MEAEFISIRPLISFLQKVCCDSKSTIVINCTTGGLDLQYTSENNISCSALRFDREDLLEYKIDKELYFGVDLDTFRKIVTMSETDDIIKLEVKEDKFSIEVQRTMSCISFQFEMLLNMNVSCFDIPSGDHESKISMNSHMFNQIFHSPASSFFPKNSDSILCISSEHKQFHFSTKNSNCNITFTLTDKPSFDTEYVDIEVLKECETMIRLTEFFETSKFFNIGNDLIFLSLSHNRPMLIEIPVGKYSVFQHFIAPVVNEL